MEVLRFYVSVPSRHLQENLLGALQSCEHLGFRLFLHFNAYVEADVEGLRFAALFASDRDSSAVAGYPIGVKGRGLI